MKVGLLHARTGLAGIWAPSMDAAATLAAAEINAGGGILGEDIEIVSAIAASRSARRSTPWTRLIDIDGADVIIGGHPSNLRDAVSQRISGKTPYIYTPQYEGTACGPSTVAIGSTDQELLRPALHWLRDRKRAERFFFVGNDYVWPRMAFATAARRVARARRPTGRPGLPAQPPVELADVLRRIARSGAQVVSSRRCWGSARSTSTARSPPPASTRRCCASV